MAYLSLSSVMAEMNAAEADARRLLDDTILAVNLPQSQEEPEPKLKEKPGKAGATSDITRILSGEK